MNKVCRSKYFIIVILFIINLSGCKKNEEENIVSDVRQWPLTYNESSVDKCIGANLPNKESIHLDDKDNIICIVDSKIDYENESISDLFVNNTNDLTLHKGMSHGMWVMGIICSNIENDDYISVLDNVEIYYVEVDESGLDVKKLVEDLRKAEIMGAKVVNCSFVMSKYYEELFDFMNNSSMLFVCAVGNAHKNEVLYPASFDLDNVVSVMGTTKEGLCSKYSNYSVTIDIAAPGEEILCITDEIGKYVVVSGSSLATAYVTSACSYIINRTSCTAYEAKQILLENCIEVDTLENKVNNNKFLSYDKLISTLE